ncbi:Rv3654c family TadE-like protein [Salinibacterium sp. ZJ454]|uniref:Rv3654c family TadE-like protein n=1 Tax=Salinibacterium sp. ZJ454 TaxID=2708339 RepID=UPI0014234482|nr:Rv3654c family TadE-like protein [Salinibacterium sp. ZJ454]
MSSERGAGTVLGLAVIAALIGLASLMLPVSVALVAKQRVTGAADATALAAADVATGLVAGYPCEVAASVAAANGTALAACQLDGLVATVRVSATVGVLPVSASATAGPAP